MKKIFFILTFLFLPFVCFGGYLRTPQGDKIYSNKVNFYLDKPIECQEANSWAYDIEENSEDIYPNIPYGVDEICLTENDFFEYTTQIENSFLVVDVACFSDDSCHNQIVWTPEYDMFFLNVPSFIKTASKKTIDYISKVSDDLKNYIALMLGLPISFWFIEKVIELIKTKDYGER